MADSCDHTSASAGYSAGTASGGWAFYLQQLLLLAWLAAWTDAVSYQSGIPAAQRNSPFTHKSGGSFCPSHPNSPMLGLLLAKRARVWLKGMN